MGADWQGDCQFWGFLFTFWIWICNILLWCENLWNCNVNFFVKSQLSFTRLSSFNDFFFFSWIYQQLCTLSKTIYYILCTDKRTDVWSRDFIRGRPQSTSAIFRGEGVSNCRRLPTLGGEGSQECRCLHFWKNNRTHSPSKNFLQFVLLRKNIHCLGWVVFGWKSV